MDGSIRLSAGDRKTLLQVVRRGTDPVRRLRARVLLLLDDRVAWSVVGAVLFTSAATINRWRRRYLREGVAVITGRRPRRSCLREWWLALVLRWVTMECPTHYGFVRSRWTCETVVLLLRGK